MKLIIFVLLLVPFLASAAPGYGVVTLVKGQVEAVNSAGEKRNLKVGDKIFESETIVTQKKSAARLAMMDTNVIEIYPSSNMKIQQYIYNPKEDQKNVNLEVSQGRIKSTVKQKYDNDKNKYNVKTPVIVAGVRGTTFSAEHEPKSQQSRVITFEGNVLVGKRGPDDMVKEFFAVKANQAVSLDAKPESKPEVKELPRIEQEKIKQDDKKEGFEKPVNLEPVKAIEARDTKVNVAPAAAAEQNVSAPPSLKRIQDPASAVGADRPAPSTIIRDSINNRIDEAKAREAIIRNPVNTKEPVLVAPIAPAPNNPDAGAGTIPVTSCSDGFQVINNTCVPIPGTCVSGSLNCSGGSGG